MCRKYSELMVRTERRTRKKRRAPKGRAMGRPKITFFAFFRQSVSGRKYFLGIIGI